MGDKLKIFFTYKMSRTITLEVVSPETFMNITTNVPATELILRSYRVDILGTSTIPYRNLGVIIGNTVNSTYIIDNQEGYNFFRIPLQSVAARAVGTGGVSVTSTFVSGCHIPLTMTGNLDHQFFLNVFYLDRSVTPNVFKPMPSADLVYLSLTFEALAPK